MSVVRGGRMRIVEYLFIDGGCLRELLKRLSDSYFGGEPIRLNYGAMSEGFAKTFYYDSLPARKGSETLEEYERRVQPQVEFFDSLRGLDGWHVYEGTARERRKQVQQKKVDIMIAVNMLTHSFRRNMDKVTFLTSDLDFKPLVDALVQDGMHVTLWYPPKYTNLELVHAADARKQLRIEDIYEWTERSFKQGRGIPQVRAQVGKPPLGSSFNLLATWKNKVDADVELYQGGSKYIVVTQDENNSRHFLMVEHSDLGALELYITETYPYIGWGLLGG